MGARTSWIEMALGTMSWLAAVHAGPESPAPAACTSPAPVASPTAAPCTAPEYRQFDFWVGNWDVQDPAGKGVVGTNRITREYGGCVLQEHWRASGPQQQIGSSFNTYSSAAGRWHQT